jgi:hypothetical protein
MDRDFREAVGDAANSGVGAPTAVVLSARVTARLSRTLTNAAPSSTQEMEAMMRQSDNIPGIGKMDYEAWSALLRPLYGRHSFEGGELNSFSVRLDLHRIHLFAALEPGRAPSGTPEVVEHRRAD